MSADIASTAVVVPSDNAIVEREPLSDSGTRLTNGGEIIQQKSAQDCRVDEVSASLTEAYRRAGTVPLTDVECAALMAPFPDEVVEIRPDGEGFLYISHIEISDRLNTVLKPGQWALICRRAWYDAVAKEVYGEYVLVIRGCFAGESVGANKYIPTNSRMNYGDCLEATAAEALKRIAGKRLSCGTQVWRPEYCRQWKEKYAAFGPVTRNNTTKKEWYKRAAGPKQPQAESQQQPQRQPAKQQPAAKQKPKPKDGTELLAALEAYDSWMTREGLCTAGECVVHVRDALANTTATSGKVYGPTVELWPAESIEAALAKAKAFDNDCRARKANEEEHGDIPF
jgi:hypothetical protein